MVEFVVVGLVFDLVDEDLMRTLWIDSWFVYVVVHRCYQMFWPFVQVWVEAFM